MRSSDGETTISTSLPIAQEKAGTGADRPPLPMYILFAVACGNLGVSIQANVLVNLIVYFYLPPKTAELPLLVTDKKFLEFINAISLILAFGRLIDGVTDVLIANWSDSFQSKWGRRIPFMFIGVIPAAAGTALMFVPPVTKVSNVNIIYLIFMQIVLFTCITLYYTPLLSLIPDLGATPHERLNLTVWASTAWAVGMVVSAMAYFLGPALFSLFPDTKIGHMRAWQLAIALLCIVGFIAMVVPVFMINEPKWSRNESSSVPFFKSLRTCLGNKYYRILIVSDFCTFCGTNILQTGLIYYVTVLLYPLKEYVSTILILCLVVISIFLYPVVALLAKKINGGKALLLGAFAIEAGVFLFVSLMGCHPKEIDGKRCGGLAQSARLAQAIVPIIVFTVPYSILTTMFAWSTADIAEHHTLKTGEAVAGMFYASRTFFQKLSTTVSVIVFALLLQLGKDVDDDLGLRLSAVVGAGLAVCAGLLMLLYNEKEMRTELQEMLDEKKRDLEGDEKTPGTLVRKFA